MNNPEIDENLLRAMAQAQGGNHYTPPTMLVDLPSRGLLYPDGHPLKGKESLEINLRFNFNNLCSILLSNISSDH